MSTRCSSTRGPATRAVLGDVADQDHGAVRSLRDLAGSARAALAHLRDRARRARQPSRVTASGSSRSRRRPDARPRASRPPPASEVSASAGTARAPRAEALGAQPHLRGRLLAGDVEHAVARGAERRRAPMPVSVDLPIPGAAEQHHRARHQAAAEHAVELVDAGAQPADRGRRDVAQRTGLAAVPRPCRSPRACGFAGWARGASTRVFQLPQPAQRPDHASDSWPARAGRRTSTASAPCGPAYGRAPTKQDRRGAGSVTSLKRRRLSATPSRCRGAGERLRRRRA